MSQLIHKLEVNTGQIFGSFWNIIKSGNQKKKEKVKKPLKLLGGGESRSVTCVLKIKSFNNAPIGINIFRNKVVANNIFMNYVH